MEFTLYTGSFYLYEFSKDLNTLIEQSWNYYNYDQILDNQLSGHIWHMKYLVSKKQQLNSKFYLMMDSIYCIYIKL